MTSFNAVGAILPLDEYWENCVHPKPLIPPSYPGAKFHTHSNQAGPSQEGETRQVCQRQVVHRQPGNVRSYKDEDDNDDDDDGERVGTSGLRSADASADSDFKSNESQINYELDDFNKTYCDQSSPWQSESSNSLQGCRPNVNTAPPDVGQKGHVKSRLDLNFKNRWNKRGGKQTNRKNNGNTFHHPGANQNHIRGQQQQQARFMQQQHMRSAYNSFRDNILDQSSDVLMNHMNNLQTIPQNPPDLGYSSPITSMIDSVANLSDSRVYNQSYVSCETPGPSFNAGYAAQGQLNTSGSAMDAYTVQQVANHVMLMMTTVRNIDTQETPEYFKSKKSVNAAEGQSHISDQPEGFN